MLASILLAIAVVITLTVPALLLWGWLRWSQNDSPGSRSSSFSLIGFSLATASAVLALSTHLYVRFFRNLPLQGPTLMKIYACGCLLSVAGIAFAVAGSGRPNPVRWLAPVCAVGTLVFWLLAMGTE
jgi:peptidoglycan biosynthesis protein MviN/MurJ (putative lipid II flippase)